MKRGFIEDIESGRRNLPRKMSLPDVEWKMLYYEIVSGRNDYKYVWRVVNDKMDEEITPGHTYYKWTKSTAFKNSVHAIEAERRKMLEDMRDELKKELRANIELGISESGDAIITNFRDREQALNWLNKQINLTSDEKTRVDYLKMLSDLSRFKENENKDKEQDIQRFYTPLLCSECKLYDEQRKRMEKIERDKRKSNKDEIENQL